MGKFAKIFEIGEDQLLVMIQLSEEEVPKVLFKTRIKNDVLQIVYKFYYDKDDVFSYKKAIDAAEKSFNTVDLAKAEKMKKYFDKVYASLIENP